MTKVNLKDLIERVNKHVVEELASMPEVIDVDTVDVATLPIKARRWHRLTDVVAVVADLKNSTGLDIGKRAGTVASIYEAGTGNLVEIVHEFDAEFIQIQGDGVLALFWGDYRYERALCAGITIKTFSRTFAGRLEVKWPDTAEGETGYKVGVASGQVLVKRVGIPRKVNWQEPIWPGQPLNYATKAAQSVDRHDLAVTASVWKRVEANEYLAFSCDCSTPSPGIWSAHTIDRLPDGNPERNGRLLEASWCEVHGAEFCAAILAGSTKRYSVQDLRLKRALKHVDRAGSENARQARLAR